MKIVVIGAVAAGTSAAAKARRNSEDAEIVIYEKDGFISYSGCSMPYYIGGEVTNFADLVPRDSAFFKEKYNIDILTAHEVLAVSPDAKTVAVKNLTTGELFTEHYDKLIIATGARANVPVIEGSDRANVFTLRNINDMKRIKAFIDEKHPRSAVIIGSGFIGLELCENLKRIGLEVTILEKLPQVMPGLDSDMAVHVEDHIKKNGVSVMTNVAIGEIKDKSVVLADCKEVEADMVIISTGIRPNTEIAKEAGITLGVAGAIRVNRKMQTSFADIYACGDCVEQIHLLTGEPVYRPLGSTANKTGRIAGDNVTGGDSEFRGILGTAIFRVFDMAVAQTGFSEREAREHGYNVVVCHNIKPDRPEFMGGREMIIKGIADKVSGRFLGAQIVGFGGVDRRIDVFATAITFKALAEDLFHLDLAYAPPYSTAKDPVMYTGMILDNAIRKGRELISVQELDSLIKSGEEYVLIDVRAVEKYENDHIDTARSIPHEKLRDDVKTLNKDTVTVAYCDKGVTSNAAQNILLGKGIVRVLNLSGGHEHYGRVQGKK